MSLDTWGELVKLDALQMFVGEQIGGGAARRVYAHGMDKDLVIKVEIAKNSFQNALEWSAWHDLKDTKLGKWLAPCEHISDWGVALIQRRTQPIRADELPNLIPNVFTDLKVRNWGMLNGRIVCHDYGMLMCHERAASASRMHKAEWWEDRYGYIKPEAKP